MVSKKLGKAENLKPVETNLMTRKDLSCRHNQQVQYWSQGWAGIPHPINLEVPVFLDIWTLGKKNICRKLLDHR